MPHGSGSHLVVCMFCSMQSTYTYVSPQYIEYLFGDSASWETCPWSQHVFLSPPTPPKEGIPGEGWAHSLGCILWIHSCLGSEIASQAIFLDHWPLTWDGPIFPLEIMCWNLVLTPWACHLSHLPLSLQSPPLASISSSSFWTPVCCLKTAQQAVPPIQPQLCHSSLVLLWKRIHNMHLFSVGTRSLSLWLHVGPKAELIPDAPVQRYQGHCFLSLPHVSWIFLKHLRKGWEMRALVLHLTALRPSPFFIIPPVGKAGFTLPTFIQKIFESLLLFQHWYVTNIVMEENP